MSIPGLVVVIVILALVGGWTALAAAADPTRLADAARRELTGERGVARKERRAWRRAARMLAAERDATRALEEELPRAIARIVPDED